MRALYVFGVTILFAMTLPAAASEQSLQATFDHLKTLEGNWKSTSSKTTIDFMPIANGTSIVETWTMSPTRRSMTVYTMDKDRILATHYCPQGNAPRLQLSGDGGDGTYRFRFLDGANLHVSDGSHNHAFSVLINDPNTFVKKEIYIANGSIYDPERDPETTETFTRVQ